MCGDGQFFSTKEAAEYTGYSVSRFRHLVCDGYVPYTKPRGRLYFKKSDLDNFILNNL